MNRVVVLALAAPLLLVGAAYPKGNKAEAMIDEPPVEMVEGPVTYRPCRPGPGDDRCIQLYERGVRASYARWLRDRRSGEPRTEVAMGGPDEPVGYHRRHHGNGEEPVARHRRHHGSHAERCLDREEADEARGM